MAPVATQRRVGIDLVPLNWQQSLLYDKIEILEGVTDIDLVVSLKLREEALLGKCLGRRICSECGGNYNVACIDIKGEDGKPGMYMAALLPPPHCASKLITQSDDAEEVVKERLRI
ncbi:putative adenylate kinase 1 chloroplastic [Prunus yedoensis var. nudiflora]|uniref:Putative adenylate kinase 1 chloroplastic n=1 Tax=Prunus yedoensis var. nudiflora TaxID=2094558 RepID=A0A314ZEF2_PRUYE|nr:putative adenylate kinase 1 chloroplastic [Prunus yedoensis var. nudiflora]